MRQSVIANLLKAVHDLLLVQVFAGQKYPSTTKNYRQTGIEELKVGIEKYHPLADVASANHKLGIAFCDTQFKIITVVV